MMAVAMRVLRTLAVVLLAATAPSLVVAAEPDFRGELEVDGCVSSIEITPSGALWIVTGTGNAYVSRDGNTSWREATIAPPPADPADPLPFYDSLDQVRFFDETRGIASGYLSKSGENHVFRTEDGGKTWSLGELPEELWVYDSQVTPQGLAWLVGSTGDVLMSADYGRTWRRLKPPFDSESRSHSVHFLDRNSGVVGSLDGQLKLTRDGGKSWKLLSAPKAAPRQGQEYTDVRIDRVRLVDGGIAVLQLGEAYWRPLSKSSWAPLRASGKRLVAFERQSEGLVAVTEALQIVHVTPRTGAVRLTGGFLNAPPLDLSVRDERVVILDETLKVYQPTGGDVLAGRMLRADRGTHWPIVAWDRLPDGTFLGASSRFLYRSSDRGATWERLGETERAVHGAAARHDGTLVLWDGHGDVSSFDPSRRVLSKVAGLNGLDVVDVFRRGDLWVAFGGMQDETTRRIEVARTYSSGQFAGSVDYGFVAVSKDDGLTWNVVDRWKEGGVQQIHLADDDSITLLSWLCAVRRGRLQLRDGAPPKAELTTVLPATEETRKDVPYVERASVGLSPLGRLRVSA